MGEAEGEVVWWRDVWNILCYYSKWRAVFGKFLLLMTGVCNLWYVIDLLCGKMMTCLGSKCVEAQQQCRREAYWPQPGDSGVSWRQPQLMPIACQYYYEKRLLYVIDSELFSSQALETTQIFQADLCVEMWQFCSFSMGKRSGKQ